MTQKQSSPGMKSRATFTPPSDNAHFTKHRRQSSAWRRRPWLDCGCSDTCRCEYKRTPSEKRTTAYREAVEHLAKHGLAAAALTAECRELWRRGGSDRDLAQSVVRRWCA